MLLEKLKLIWGWLLKLSPETLRFLVMILLVFILFQCNIDKISQTFRDEIKSEKEAKRDRELYMTDITPKVLNILEDVVEKDESASNVLLLNYHNTLTSSHGLPYKYLTGLCESFLEAKPCIDYWKELDYMNYGEEIEKINIRRCLLINDTEIYRKDYPKFTYLVERSGAKSAVFYSLIGADSSVGMLVVLYDNELPELTLDHLRKVISPTIQPLAVLLDYDYAKTIK